MQNLELMDLYDARHSFIEKDAFLFEVVGERVSCHDFYREIFPKGWLQSRYASDPDAPGNGKLIAVANVQQQGRSGKSKGKLYRRNIFLTDDLNRLDGLHDRVAFVAPCSFISGKGKGKESWWVKKDTKHLRFLHALVVDLDEVEVKNLNDLIYQIEEGFVPQPTYIVNSGTGLHLYYVLTEPVKIWQNNYEAFKALKDAIIDLCWNGYTSQSDSPQYSGLVQPYRIPGSRTKLDLKPGTDEVTGHQFSVSAYKTGEKWSVGELLFFNPTNTYMTGNYQRNIERARSLFNKLYDEKIDLEKARELWPDWYQKRIVEGKPKKSISEYKWHLNPALYEWWLRTIKEKGAVGHRYFCIFILAAYARKCDISFTRLRQDANSCFEIFENRTTEDTNHFKHSDIEQALKAFWKPEIVKMTRRQIAYLSGIEIKKSHRDKPRPQKQHLAGARAVQNTLYPNGEWRNNGRPKGSPNKQHPKKEAILTYVKKHPEATQRQIAEALGISKTTVNKWLKEATEQKN